MAEGVNPDRLNLQQLAWVREWVEKGTDMSLIVEELRRHGLSDRAILAGLEAVRPRGNALANGAMQSLPIFRRAPPGLRRLEAPGIDIYTLEGFMNPAECAKLIEIIMPALSPSTLADVTYDREFRTSRTAFTRDLRSSVIDAIEARVCRTLGINPTYATDIQVQHYDVGQQFKPHWDYFEPGGAVYQRHAGIRGNRTWTFMVYLNEDMEGGATRFTEVDLSVQPRMGMALFWNNLNADGSPNVATRHCGEPVTKGRKLIITKWFRVHGDGPVLLD